MGYVSDVAFRVRVKDGVDMVKIVKDLDDRLKKEITSDYDISNDCDKIEYNFKTNELTLVWYSVKWYDGYPEVDLVESWFTSIRKEIDELDEDDTVFVGCQRIRIGEDLEDNEDNWYGSLTEYMYINRTIDL